MIISRIGAGGFFFFNKYRSSFSSAQNLLSSELSSLWSQPPCPVSYPVLPLIFLQPLESASCFFNRANMLLSPGLYAWGFFLEGRRVYTSFFNDGEAMRKILRQGVALVIRVIIVWHKCWFGQKVHLGLAIAWHRKPEQTFWPAQHNRVIVPFKILRLLPMTAWHPDSMNRPRGVSPHSLLHLSGSSSASRRADGCFRLFFLSASPRKPTQ